MRAHVAGKTLDVDDDALAAIVAEGHHAAFGARFLKRTIDERIKLPISRLWRSGSGFHAHLQGTDVVVDVARTPQGGARKRAASPQVA